jgi:hypothetical protein
VVGTVWVLPYPNVSPVCLHVRHKLEAVYSTALPGSLLRYFADFWSKVAKNRPQLSPSKQDVGAF